MLDKIFKYTGLRLDFFDNMLMRASQKYALNDPFELRPSHRESNKAFADASYFDYAVVSLSETNNNLLMWSHYADQHKGMVIEFDMKKPLFDSYKTYKATMPDPDEEYDCIDIIDEEETKRRESIKVGQIQRIRYNSKRPSIYNYANVLEHFLVKSEEWIYEKEHRVILPLILADKIIVHEKYLPKIEFTLYDSTELNKIPLDDNMYLINLKEVTERDGNRFLSGWYSPTTPEEDLKYGFIESTYLEYLREISEDPSTIFLYQVPPQAIKSVFLGCRVSSADKKAVLDKIRASGSLNHIEIFQATPSNERFELEFRKLTHMSPSHVNRQ
ncbi:hypothetical protein BCU68_08510 [Vibrio sp. 10N.286.49.B3]|uniref:DUF2971 domain-containing protein n=1 Tax=Vibrio sp. 10N.286.49.B3 TaxID=1880855 RepID=UPI000C83E412|nr:DUF2971 domain-containing protein [Vibrio sp. 10N.286.49.B3]PMH37131.1 hypothetical protein BCU68_08510 [Vibrio sp. 10N.286.49.B3]